MNNSETVLVQSVPFSHCLLHRYLKFLFYLCRFICTFSFTNFLLNITIQNYLHYLNTIRALGNKFVTESSDWNSVNHISEAISNTRGTISCQFMSYASTVVCVIVVAVVVADGFDTEIITLMCRAYANKQIRAHEQRQTAAKLAYFNGFSKL